MKDKRLIVIDGNALIHRSFHALPPTLTTKDGRIVNAVYGFTSFLLKAFTDLKPDYVVLTLDRKEPTFRHKEYKEYKAKRVKAPDELYQQIPLIEKMAKAFDIPTFSLSGFEADDLIGSIVKQLENEHHLEKMIITGDLDTLQLINPHTKVYTMSRGLSDTVIYDERMVKERYQLRPDQIIDYKALRGDPSDNLPGVDGVGEKTAIELLNLFDNLENIYTYLDKNPEAEEIRPRITGLLKKSKDNAFLSKKLATIKTDIDMGFNLEKTRLHNLDIEGIKKIFTELEFKSLIPRLAKLGPIFSNKEADQPIDKFVRNKQKFDYALVNSEKDFKKFLAELKKQKQFAFDAESSDANTFSAKLLGLSFSWKAKQAYYVNLDSSPEPNLFNQQGAMHDWLEKLKPILEDKKIKKFGHNIKFDIKLLHSHRVNVAGVAFDTKLAAYLVNPSNRHHSLDALSFSELGLEKINSENLLGKGCNKLAYWQVPVEKMSVYSCEDADCTFRLVNILKKQLKEYELEKLFTDIELPLIDVLAQMEIYGIKLNLEKLKDMDKDVSKKINKLTKDIHKLANNDFNINSTQQLQKIIYNDLNIPTENIKKTKNGFSTAFDELQKLKDLHPIIPMIQSYRELKKLQSTYIQALPELVNTKTKRLHTSFKQTVTATGRLSSTEPNLQNIPVRHGLGKEIRQAFIAEKGYKLLAIDYSQIELRLAAHMSGDENLIDAFNNNQDIHTATAANINQISESEVTSDMRREAKAVNFGILYGQGPHGLSQNADIPYARAREFITRYFTVYSGVKKFINDTIQSAKDLGYVKTLFDRRRYVPEINSEISLVKKAGERIAVNTPLQGTAADLIKLAMLQVANKFSEDPNIRMLLQVHDELIFEIKPDKLKEYAKEIQDIMENIVQLKVPIIADIKTGDNWGQLKPLDI